jgi:glutathione S-transferase
MYKVFGMSASGNCYKVKLLLKQLGIDFQWIEVDILQGETRTAEFLEMNPNGKVPTLQIGEDQFLPESNAILCYLADGTPLWSTERLKKAETLQWLFFEQYSHEPYIAVARFIKKLLPPDHPRRAELPRLLERGYQALQVMEKHLSNSSFFVDSNYSIADIALYAYS